MKAIRTADETTIEDVPTPEPTKPGRVTIDVAYAGLCKTDVYVAEGRIPARRPLTLGHEFSGTIRAVGGNVEFEPGDRVAVDPVIRCGYCWACENGRRMACENQEMLGVDYDGAFAEVVEVSASNVYPIPDEMGLKTAAFAEPVAATASYHKGLPGSAVEPDYDIGVYGRGRLADLAKRIIEAEEWRTDPVDTVIPGADGQNGYDCMIATTTHDGLFRALLRHVRPGGTIIVKSRPDRPLKSFPMKACVEREITIQATNYWPFEGEGREVLERLSKIKVNDLIGEPNSMETFVEYVRGDRERPESPKLFMGLD